MAAPYNPLKKGEDLLFYISLEDYQNPGNIKITPTLAAGDVKISKDGGALANLNTLPSESPAGSGLILVTVSATELTQDSGAIRFIDQTSPKEWADLVVPLVPTQ